MAKKQQDRWYRDRNIIQAIAIVLVPFISWFLNVHSNKQGITLQKNVSTSLNAETKGNLSPEVVTYGPNSPVNIYQITAQSDVNSKNKEIDANRPL